MNFKDLHFYFAQMSKVAFSGGFNDTARIFSLGRQIDEMLLYGRCVFQPNMRFLPSCETYGSRASCFVSVHFVHFGGLSLRFLSSRDSNGSCVREVCLLHNTVKALGSHWLRHIFGRVVGGVEAFGFPSYL